MAAGIVQFSAESTISGSNKVVNVFHVKVDGVPSATEATNLLAPYKAFYDSMAAYWRSGTQWVIGAKVLHWGVSDWTPALRDSEGKVIKAGEFNAPPVIIGATAKTSVAATGTTPIAPQLACCVSWRTAFASRNARGRTYLGNFAAQADNQGVVIAALTTIINTQAGALLTAVKAVTVVGAAASPTIWSPTNGSFNEIVAGSTDNIWDTMRSRVR
jgi:hypothetical protein